MHGPAGALSLFLLGLVGSLHCLGMCGPLACLFSRPEEDPVLHLGLYHGSRLLAYGVVGASFAWLGAPLRPMLSWPVLAAIAVLPLLIWAVWPRDWAPAFLSRWHGAAMQRLRGLSPARRAIGIGLLTPALPCGLLYAAAAASISAPNPALGAAWMLAFGAGTLPLLAAGQAGYVWAARRGEGRWALPLRRLAAVLAAATLIFFAFLR
jgi:uncharacterized protein